MTNRADTAPRQQDERAGHTPGPWRDWNGGVYANAERETEGSISGKRLVCIARVDPEDLADLGLDEDEAIAEAHANLAMMADAPALLDALHAMHRKVEREAALHEWDYKDHACAECAPESEILREGFQCARHASAAFLRKHGRLS